MVRQPQKSRKGFSLIELVIVVVIIGIIAAIAIPRMSRGSAGAADSALAGNLSVLRNAIDMYSSEHGGLFPTVAGFSDQLTKYTKVDGTGASATKDPATGVIYGPYLRKVPPLPVGNATEKGSSTVVAPGADPTVVVAGGHGWTYAVGTGAILPNTGSQKDGADKLYTDY